MSFTNKKIIVGENSSVVRRLITKFPSIREEFDIVAHNKVHSIVSAYDECIVFSYSLKMEDNRKLISSLCRVASSVLYISSSSVIVALAGERYEYPSVKLKCEQFGMLNYSNFHVLRLGTVVDSSDNTPLCVGVISELNDIAITIRQFNASSPKLSDCFKWSPHYYSSNWKCRLIRNYSKIQCALLPYSVIMRPIDWIARFLGFPSYGYTSLSDRLWSTTK